MTTFSIRKLLRGCAALALAALFAQGAFAQEAQIRKALAERLPDLPKIDEVTKTGVPGLYEIRIGSDVLYTDERGDYLIEGTIIDTKSRVNLTEARVEKLTAIDFAALPLRDAVVYKQGTGARKLVVFADPNCGYCKQFEKNLQQVKDVTIYTFLYPILGPDSAEKSRNIWCAKGNGAVWREWMVNGTLPVKPAGECDTSALVRNLAMGKRFKVNGTPNLVFENGKRIPGALPPEQVEKQFADHVASR